MVSFKKDALFGEYVEVSTSCATAKIALLGATLFSYKKKSELFWLSSSKDFTKEIVGGVSICWPYFGRRENEPIHGFARGCKWKIFNISEDEKQSQITLSLDATWRYKYRLHYTITIGEKLTLELSTTNEDCKDFNISCAFHSYLSVSHIKNISLFGLESKNYLDATNGEKKTQNGEFFIDGECDRVYEGIFDELSLVDGKKKVGIYSNSSSQVVIWNPYETKEPLALDDDFTKMICIENVDGFGLDINLKPKQTHTLRALFSHR